jgi:hypothetical protein
MTGNGAEHFYNFLLILKLIEQIDKLNLYNRTGKR